jgi:predicted ferric reductase
MERLRLRVVPTVGSVVLLAIAVIYPALWLVERPVNEPTGRYLGEMCGAEAVLLLSCCLVLATLLPPIERAFGGIDRVAVWHKRVATAAVLLLVPHLALVGSPPDPYATSIGNGLGSIALLGLVVLALWALAPKLRAARWPGPIRHLARLSYERWLTAHRLTGLFVVAAVTHGAIVDPVFHRSSTLRITFLVAGGIGIAAYLYRELLARYFIPIHDYVVADVTQPNDTTVEVSLEPVNAQLEFAPGQFVVLAFGGASAWQRHPFSVSSAPSQRRLQVSIKASGDYTDDLHDKLETGTPAKVVGPFGGFEYHDGGRDQIWIAGGIGVTPFLSWIRALDGTFDRNVDFFYSVAQKADALYLEEFNAAAANYPTFHARLVDTGHDGFLTAEEAMIGRPPGADVWVYMCGPPPMMTSLADGFRGLGIPASRVRWEQFDIR